MCAIAINMVWFNRDLTSSDYIVFKNLLYGFIKLNKKSKSLNLAVYIKKRYKNDILKFLEECKDYNFIQVNFIDSKFEFFKINFKKYELVFTPNWYFLPAFGNKKNKFISLVHDAGWKKINPFRIRALYGRFFLLFFSFLLRQNLVFTTKSVNQEYTNLRKIIGVPILFRKIESKMDLPFKKYFLIISTNLPHKNLSIIRKIINNQKTNYNIVLIGNHTNFDIANVKVYNNISDPDKWFLISNSLALINPSKYEGFGMPVAEAVLKKKYVIVSNLKVYSEFVEGGLVVVNNHNDVEEWISRLNEFWNYNNNLIVKKYGKPKINKNFVSPKNVANNIMNFINQE